jgi:hypothetical protein
MPTLQLKHQHLLRERISPVQVEIARSILQFPSSFLVPLLHVQRAYSKGTGDASSPSRSMPHAIHLSKMLSQYATNLGMSGRTVDIINSTGALYVRSLLAKSHSPHHIIW